MPLGESEVLILGCGTSALPQTLAHAGRCRLIVATDIMLNDSPYAEKVEEGMTPLRWQYADAMALSFEDGAFDIIVEKGTFAAIGLSPSISFLAPTLTRP